MNKWTKRAIVTAIASLLFLNPFTRAAIRFILPLGSGIDDLIFFAALVVALSMYVRGHWVEEEPELDRTRRMFIAIVVGAVTLGVTLMFMLG